MIWGKIKLINQLNFMRLKKTIVNVKPLDKLLKKASEAIEDLIKDLDQEFEAVIEDSGAFSDIGLPNRDIVWSGELRDSQKMKSTIQSGKYKVTWEWDPVDPESGYHYAKDVFVGFVSYSGNFIPGRNWPGKAVDRIEPILYLRKKFKEK